MFQKIRIFLRYTLSWIVVIGCVALLGFVLYPLLAEKYTSMALPKTHRYTGGFTVKHWYPLEIERNKERASERSQAQPQTTKLDTLEAIATKNVSDRAKSFFKTFKDAFSTNTNKKTVDYSKDETGAYREQ